MVLDLFHFLLGGGRGGGEHGWRYRGTTGCLRGPIGGQYSAHTRARAGPAPFNLQGEWACAWGWGKAGGVATGSTRGATSARSLEGPRGRGTKIIGSAQAIGGRVRGLWSTDLDFPDHHPPPRSMATPLPSGPAGIPGLRRTSVLHPAVGGLGVFLGGSGELRDGLQLQLLLPARVSLPGLDDLRRGSGQQSFLNVITWNISTGLKSWLSVAGGVGG